MKRKLVVILSFVFMFFLFASLNVQALITNKYDLQNSADKLEQLCSYDYLSFVNKSELVGYRLSNFEMITSEYQRNIVSARDSIIKDLNRIDIVENSSDFSDSEKQMQLRQIYNNSDYILSDVNSKTISYLISLSKCLPTITYQKYKTKFQDFYNELNISGDTILVK